MKKWEKPIIQELKLGYTMEDISFRKPSQKPIDPEFTLKICYCDQTKYTYGLGCGHEYSPDKNNCPHTGPVLQYEQLPMCS